MFQKANKLTLYLKCLCLFFIRNIYGNKNKSPRIYIVDFNPKQIIIVIVKHFL